jgi:hypothetical protein
MVPGQFHLYGHLKEWHILNGKVVGSGKFRHTNHVTDSTIRIFEILTLLLTRIRKVLDLIGFSQFWHFCL